MQFATLTASGARPVLIDAVEYSFLEQAVDIPDEPMDEAALEWKLAYGVFLPQPYKEPEVAAAKLRGHAGGCFGAVTLEGACRLYSVLRIHLYAPVLRTRQTYFPCVVLVGMVDKIPPLYAERALVLFPRLFEKMNARTNLFNRPGILALKGEVEAARSLIRENPQRDDWLNFADEQYAARIAQTIF